MSEQERWLDVVGYEGLYMVSDHGRVRSLDRTKRHWRGGTLIHRGRILKFGVDTDGYLHVGLVKDMRQTTRKVHQLVLAAFVGPMPAGLQVAHGDGCRKSNALSNLRYTTAKGNANDRVRHGRQTRGEATGTARLTPDQVLEIRNSGLSLSNIASSFGISKTQAARIVRRESWAHL